jgi:hypothetical protein
MNQLSNYLLKAWEEWNLNLWLNVPSQPIKKPLDPHVCVGFALIHMLE